MTVETLVNNNEFEQILHHETERKLLPVFPERLRHLRAEAMPIEQYYLSHIDEPFSLRFRETCRDGKLSYEATLKDTGHITESGIDRLEVPVSVSPELYQYYFDEQTTPVLRKLRSEPTDGVIVDFYDDDSVQVEIEQPTSWQTFTERFGDDFMDISGDRLGNNEWRAHLSFRRLHDGHEAFAPGEDLTSASIVHDVLAQHTVTHGPVTVHIGGRSGSGKSTIVREVQHSLEELGLTSGVLSTDDYHRGTSWLRAYNNGEDWIHWDEPIVYDTATMAQDLQALERGEAIATRAIDWTVAEPIVSGTMTMPDVLIIEGIYANAPEIMGAGDLTYEMTTPLATCIGRRLLRDMRERPQFADPGASLFYMLNEAEPAYRAQLAARNQQ